MAGLSRMRCAALAGCAAAAALLPQPGLAAQLALGVPAVAVFGLPHGAHDWALARQPHGPGVAVFALVYAALGGAAALMAWQAPGLALAGFVLLGIAHFGAEDAEALGLGGWPVRLALGALPVLGPAAFRPGQTTLLLHLLGVDLPAHALGIAGLGALAAAAALLAATALRHRGSAALLAREAALCLLLAWAAPPVLSFAAYFCLVHAPRHLAALPSGLRSWTAGPVTALAILLIACPIGLAAAGRGWAWGATNALFWGLASLAWPHAALAGLGRHAGWARAAA